MPRTRAENEKIRESRRLQILDAALTVYIQKGFNGTDMDDVAAQATMAKGLIYYYFKNKRVLFRELFEWAFGFYMESNNRLCESVSAVKDPVERLVRYTRGVFDLMKKDSRVLRFAMRLPFDAYAVFGPQEWQAGIERSTLFMASLRRMIADIDAAGLIPPVDAAAAANCFWAVFIANSYQVTQMIGAGNNSESAQEGKTGKETLQEILTFCLQGLGLPQERWIQYTEDTEEED